MTDWSGGDYMAGLNQQLHPVNSTLNDLTLGTVTCGALTCWAPVDFQVRWQLVCQSNC